MVHISSCSVPIWSERGKSRPIIETPEPGDTSHLESVSFLSEVEPLTYHTACVSFIRFFKSAIFVSRFRSSSLRLALSFWSLPISFPMIPELGLGAYSTIRALECLSRTSSVETFSNSLARYRSFSSVPPYMDTGISSGLSIGTYMVPPLHMILVGSYLLLIDACYMIDS